jgi:WD40 repeat protein
VASTSAVVAFQQNASARSAARTAIEQRDQAVVNEVVAEALQLRSTDPSLAARLELAAYRMQPSADNASRLFSMENILLATVVRVEKGRVDSVAFSPDGRTLVRGGSDGRIQAYALASGAAPVRAGGLVGTGASDVWALAFRPDGRVLATGNDASIRLWTMTSTGQISPLGQPITAHQKAVTAVAFSPDGHLLASVGGDGTRLWNVSDPAHPRPAGQPLAGQTDVASSVAFSPDGHLLAAPSPDGSVQLWNITDPARPVRVGRPLPGLTGAVTAYAFSPDGQTLAVGTFPGRIRLYAIADPGHPLMDDTPLVNSGMPISSSLAFSRDGHTLAAGSRDNAIRLWDVTDPLQPAALGQPLTGHAGWVFSVTFSPDGRTLASASGDGTIRLWTMPQRLPGSAAVATRDGRLLFTVDHAGQAQLWNVADPASPALVTRFQAGSTSSSTSLALSRDGHTLAVTSDDVVRLWDVTSPGHPRPAGHAFSARTGTKWAGFITNGILVTASYDGTIQIWLTAGQKPGLLYQSHPHAEFFNDMAVSPSTFPATLASAEPDWTVKLWSLFPPRLASKPLTGHNDAVVSVAYSPDGRTLASTSLDDTIRLWSVAAPGHPALVGQPITGGDGDHLQFISVKAMVTTGSATRLWDLDPARVVSQICAETGNNLTPAQWHRYIPQLPYSPPCATP